MVSWKNPDLVGNSCGAHIDVALSAGVQRMVRDNPPRTDGCRRFYFPRQTMP